MQFFAILVIKEHHLDRDQTVLCFDASSDDPDALWKNSTIAVRSNRDRGAIEPRSWSVQCGINSTIVRKEVVRIYSEIDAQSTHDQATIVVDPGEKRGQEEAEIMAKLRPIHGQSRSCNVAPRNRSHYLSNRLHDRLQLATIFGPISSSNPCISSLFFNF